jgi:hypothetical protein
VEKFLFLEIVACSENDRRQNYRKKQILVKRYCVST